MKGLILIIAILFCSCAERPSQKDDGRRLTESTGSERYIVNVVDDSFKVIKSFKSLNRPSMVDGGALTYRGEDGRNHLLVNVKLDVVR